MSQTELHLLHLRLLDAINEAFHLEPDASEKLIGLLARLAVDAKLLFDGLAELVVGDKELVLDLLLHNVLSKELVKGLGDLAFHELLDALHGVLGVLELGESLQLDNVVGRLSICEALVKFVQLLQLLVLGDLEQGESGSRLKQNVHGVGK